MNPLRKLGPLGLVVASAVIVNCGYVATNLYDFPEGISLILIPCTLVLCLGWFLRDMKRTILLSIAVILLSAFFMQISLTTPVMFGAFENVYNINLFIYGVFLRVIRYVIATTIFVLTTALVAGLAFE